MNRTTLINLIIGLVLVGTNVFFFSMKSVFVDSNTTDQDRKVRTGADGGSIPRHLVDDFEDVAATFSVQLLVNQDVDTIYRVQRFAPGNTGQRSEWINIGEFENMEKANQFRNDQIHKIIQSERKH